MRKQLTVAALALIAAAGCTTAEPGDPGAAGGGTSTPTGTSSAPDPTTAPRPADLPLDAVAPCSVLTDAQRTELKVDRSRERTNDSEHFQGMKECLLNVSAQEPFYNYTAVLMTREGIGPWLTGHRNVDAKGTAVGGYPAATYHLAGSSGLDGVECSTAVEVAANQSLVLGVLLISEDALTQEQLCQMSEHAAGLAMATLRSLK